MGARGSFTLFGSERDARDGVHQSLLEHLTSEYRATMTHDQSGRQKDEWAKKPNTENHLFDCFVGCAVAASVSGLQWTPDATLPRPKKLRPKISLDDLTKAAAEQPLL